MVFEDHDQISRSVAFKPDNIASAVHWFKSVYKMLWKWFF